MLNSRQVALATLVVCGGIGLLSRSSPSAQGAAAPIRTDISGDWAVVSNEDQPHRAPGPELGDYTGIPLNDAARQYADTWDASSLSEPERQAQPHPVQYLMRGPGPNLRILRVLDPTTQQFVAYAIAGGFGRADRVIWMDGRPHPSDFSEHTWDGFSTGTWQNGQLVVTTTHMKLAKIQRNGVIVGDYSTFVEHFFRHGLYMTSFFSVDDPTYLEEPFVRTQTWQVATNMNLAAGNPFESVDELGDKPQGWVAHYPLGNKPTDFAKAHNLPFEATRGGKASIYPEYMDKIEQYRREEAAATAQKK